MTSSRLPAGLTDVDVADVHKAGRLAGRLRRVASDEVAFEYDPDYLADPDAVPVAATLPKVAEATHAGAGSVPPFFAGLLPEGARLVAVSTAAGTSTDDQLTLLLAVGSDAVGDVQVVPEGEALTEPEPTFDPLATQDADFADLFARAVSVDPAELARVALPGVQVKVSSSMISTPLRTTLGPAILKLEAPEHPRLVRNEHFFLSMAADCGLPVPGHELIHDRHGRAALLVERFDRVPVANASARRLAQEDACQLLGRYPAAKYRVKFEEAARALADEVAAGGGSRPLALRRVMEIAAFSYLIGNGDLHSKNLSVRRTPNGIAEVTPAYDLVTTQPYLGWRDPMALRMYGRDNKLGRRWWLEAAERLGLHVRAMRTVLGRLVDGAPAWVERVGEIGFDDPTTERLDELMRARRAELAGD